MHTNDRRLHLVLLREVVSITAGIHSLVVHPDFIGGSRVASASFHWRRLTVSPVPAIVLLPAVYLFQVSPVVALPSLYLDLLRSLLVNHFLP